MNKKNLSERDICTKFITPALEKAGWDTQLQVLEEVSFTDGKIYVRGKITARGTRKRADYILYYKPNIPVAIIEAKDNNHSVRAGIQQGLRLCKNPRYSLCISVVMVTASYFMIEPQQMKILKQKLA
jgi:type I restriction enzyme R subunit